jgi:hypothetical protein
VEVLRVLHIWTLHGCRSLSHIRQLGMGGEAGWHSLEAKQASETVSWTSPDPLWCMR